MRRSPAATYYVYYTSEIVANILEIEDRKEKEREREIEHKKQENR